MNPKKNFKPSHDKYDRDRDGESSGVNQTNPLNTENQGGDPPGHQGGDPSEPRPQQSPANRGQPRGGDRPDMPESPDKA
jgi:hypothetical protein